METFKRRIKVWLYWKIPSKLHESPLVTWLYLKGFLDDGDAEDCWVGGWELGPDD